MRSCRESTPSQLTLYGSSRARLSMQSRSAYIRERCYGISLFFFFQAEDGIRDLTVTGVQTCALPISRQVRPPPSLHALVGREVNEHAAMVVGELAARVAKPLTTSLLTPEYRREMIREVGRAGGWGRM